MDAIVRFRFNKRTGQVEEFRVDAVDGYRAADHDEQHHALASAIGQVLNQLPNVEELIPGAAAAPVEPLKLPPEGETQTTTHGPSRHASGS